MSPIAIGVGAGPVFLLVAGLIFMDSYKLVSQRMVLQAIAIGAVAAVAALAVNLALLDGAKVPAVALSRYVAPVIEELLKGLYIVFVMRRDRVGFLVDAAILGFAVGAGFAVVENLYYAQALRDPNPGLWLARGLGTAVMHGCTTAIAAVISKERVDRRGSVALVAFAPGIAAAAVIHSAFNHLALAPLVSTAVMLGVMPLLLLAAFERSEKATQDWLGLGLDVDVEVLELIHSGEISSTRVGRYLESLRDRFPGPVVADMLCLLQIQLELGLRAKGVLMARRAGVEIPIDRDVRANLVEMKYLERSIGPTGRMAILPFLRAHSRDLWQIHLMTRG